MTDDVPTTFPVMDADVRLKLLILEAALQALDDATHLLQHEAARQHAPAPHEEPPYGR